MSGSMGAGFGDYMAAAGRMPSTGEMMRPGGDERTFVRFYRRSVHNEVRSVAEGRPVVDGVDFVMIQQPGERDTVDRAAHDGDKMRWPRQWAAYQANQEQVPEGTPLDVLFPGNPEVVETLRHVRVFTVEQLAGAEGNALSNIGPGAQEWKRRATVLMEASKSAAPLHAMERQLAERDARIQQQAAQIEAMQAKLDRLLDRMGDDEEAAPRRRRAG